MECNYIYIWHDTSGTIVRLKSGRLGLGLAVFCFVFFHLRRVAPAFIFPFQRSVSCFSLVPFGFADVRSLVKNSLLVAAILFCYTHLPASVSRTSLN